ncbi:MAG TPA: hypothetical protein VGH42_01790 [Verrucomicrobiae bacterium]|jgi:hypothetical protein
MMNDEMEQFERRLSRQPLRKVPGEWRGEILAAATVGTRPASNAVRSGFLSTLNHQLSTIFWPHPKAWAGLAAVWIFIFAVNFSMRDKSPVISEKFSPPSPEVVAELKQQQRMFAELIGPRDIYDADRSKSYAPRPRSERVEILTA